MAIGDRIGRAWRTVAVLGVGLAGGAAAVAVATVPDSNGVIHACVSISDSGGGAPLTNGPNLTVIDPSAGQTCAGFEQPISWNVTGPQGPPGQTGPQGIQGRVGPQGPPGNSGTLTLGSVVPKTIAPGIGLVTIDPGKRAWSFPILSFLRATNSGDILVSKANDNLTPKLASAVSTGKHFNTVRIVIYKKSGGHQASVIFTLNEVVITSFEVSPSSTGLAPLDTLSFAYGKIKWTYP